MKYVLVTLVVALVSVGEAGGAVVAPKPSLSALKAIRSAALKHGLDAQDLVRIAFLESSFREKAVRVNSNDTIDYGLFQINSVHWTTTCRGVDVFVIKGNVECAARLLKLARKHAGTDRHWIGRYHSKKPSLKRKYVKLLQGVSVKTEELLVSRQSLVQTSLETFK